jgi:hypothetical protein
MTLQFCEERFYLFPLTLCVFELVCRPEIPRSLSRWDRKVAKWPGRTLGSLLARTTLLARSYVAERAVSLAVAAVVQLLTRRADVAVALR